LTPERSFEEMYSAAGDDLGSLPWANLGPLPELVAWLDGDGDGAPAAEGRAPAAAERGTARALVVGCGLGDDAEELGRRGYAVSAFDLSPSAIARARERFPASTVDYRVADLLDLPAEWRGRFDLVVEIRTLQSLPVAIRAAAVASIAATAAPGGRLWLFALGRDVHAPGETRPWPVSGEELDGFEAAGLTWEWSRKAPLEGNLYELNGLLRRPPA
jgi:SAM-dependent methyltransferase